MGLAVRMVLYFAFAWLAGEGIGVYDEAAGTFTIHIESATAAIVGLLGYAGTYAASRWAKARGGKT